jgi:hypothetical protein
MTKRNRKTLIEHFAEGRLPSQEAFADLIDSTINIVDDGFEKNAVHGLKVAQVDENAKLLSFFDEITVRTPVWTMALASSPGTAYAGGNYKQLSIYWAENGDNRLILASAPVGEDSNEPDASSPHRLRMGINRQSPEHEMDVGGVVASDGRIGRKAPDGLEVRADGKWHPVTRPLDGCQAFEVMAGVGKPKSGKYALTHAFAISTFNSRNSSISYHQARFSSRCDQIDLRWTGSTHEFVLEMRTRCSYEQHANEEIYVQYYLTQLWFDPFMQGCAKKEAK